jgi:hypothetical protein
MTKASPNRLTRRFVRKRPGRKPGTHFPLLEDPQRFVIAAYVAFCAQALSPFEAARLAIVLVGERTPISITDLDGVLLVLSGEYDPVGRPQELDDRVRLLVRKARHLLEIANEPERRWLEQSAGAVVGLCSMLAEDKRRGAARALQILREAGWGATIEQVGARMTTALRGNFPPYEGRLRKAGRARLERARADRARKLGGG